MLMTVIYFEPSAAPDQVEPLERALLEVIDEVRSLAPDQRRHWPRTTSPVPSQPVTFYSIEEADASAPESATAQVA